MAEGASLLIEGDGEVGGLELVEDLEEHQGKAVDGGDDLAGFRDGERGGLPCPGGAEGMKGPVHDSIAVKENQKRGAHRMIITGKGGEGIRGDIRSIDIEIRNITVKKGKRTAGRGE